MFSAVADPANCPWQGHCRHFEYFQKYCLCQFFFKSLLVGFCESTAGVHWNQSRPPPRKTPSKENEAPVSASGTSHSLYLTCPTSLQHGCCNWKFCHMFIQIFIFILTSISLSLICFPVCDSSPFPFKSMQSSLVSMASTFLRLNVFKI